MRPWRILHTESSSGWGGQELRVFAELEWMRAQGHEVALAAAPESLIANHARAAGMRFFSLDTRKAMLPVAAGHLASWILRGGFDVVNTHSSNDGWLGALATRMAGPRLLIRSRHIEVDYPNVFWSRQAFRTFPNFVLTTSERIRLRLITELEVSPSRIACIPTGVDLSRFNPTYISTLAQEFNLQPKTVSLGMISVLRSWKGHAVLLEAIERLFSGQHGDLPPVHLIIAGNGPGQEELAQRVASLPWRQQISIIGHRADVPNLLAGIDVLVLPSLAHEGVPQIILQAQAMGRAVIASQIGGIPEVVTDGMTGFLVPPGDAKILAGRLAELIRDPTLREQLGSRARAAILQNHSLDQMGERLLDLYSRLKKRRPHGKTP